MDGNEKAGFKPDTSGNAGFEGANRALLTRYEAGISRFAFGFTAEQDAGESFTSRGKAFRPDFTSAFLQFHGSGVFRKIIIGDFKATWGQGLMLGCFGARKGSQVLISPEASGLKKYSSASENGFFRGTGTTLGYGNFSLEMFASALKTDAALHKISDDSSSISWFNSPDISGLHRSSEEKEKKDAILCKSFGGHAELRKKNIVWGISYLNQQYSHQWIRKSTAYTQEIFPAGTYLQNFGSDFKASLGKVAVFSEIAFDAKARMALFGGILAELHPLVRLSLIYRNYQPDYLGIRSSGFGESSGTKNEEGFYLGLQMYPWKFLKVDFYADNYSFPFLKYNSTSPYSGNDYLLNFSIYPKRDFIVNLRFRHEKNQNRSATCITGIDPMETAKKGSYRLELNYELNKNTKLRSRLEFSSYKSAQEPVSIGYYSGHDLSLQTSSQKYKLWFRYAIFDIPKWENRIYAYENDVLGSFSVPSFNSKGARFIIMGKTDLFPGLELSLRYSVSGFRGIKTWGSGNDEVKGGRDSFYTLQVRVRM
jgi:hypothetical protein